MLPSRLIGFNACQVTELTLRKYNRPIALRLKQVVGLLIRTRAVHRLREGVLGPEARLILNSSVMTAV